MEINFANHPQHKNACTVVGCYENALSPDVANPDNQQAARLIDRSIAHSKFVGKRGQTLLIPCPEDMDASHYLLVGLGPAHEVNVPALNQAGGAVFAALMPTKVEHVNFHVSNLKADNLSAAEAAAQVALGAKLRSWKCNDFKTKLKPEHLPILQHLSIICDQADDAALIYESYQHVAEGVFLTREVVTYPPNLIYPQSLAERYKAELEPLGVKVEVLPKSALQELGMGALIGVAQGSAFDPYVVVMQWNGHPDQSQPLAFLGKGVTFDSGGLSLKPANGMEDMKYDMAGAGVVGGLMKSLALRKAKVNVVGVVGLVENMPSGTAQRPSDVVTSMSGQTIEVLNTDAEGRLVLADILWYTQNRFKPQFMINLATLTGAIIVALGEEHAGLFSNNDELSTQLTDCGLHIGEKLWRLPLSADYDKDIDSDLADMKNTGSGRGAGSITAAQFLQRFVNDTKWAHLDIAGVTWANKGLPTAEKGATAFGVRLLDHFVRRYYEQ